MPYTDHVYWPVVLVLSTVFPRGVVCRAGLELSSIVKLSGPAYLQRDRPWTCASIGSMPDCPECNVIHEKLSRTERKRDVVNRLAKATPAHGLDHTEEMAVKVQAADEEYALAKQEAEDHKRLTGHKLAP
jgi:hypothetical protein